MSEKKITRIALSGHALDVYDEATGEQIVIARHQISTMSLEAPVGGHGRWALRVVCSYSVWHLFTARDGSETGWWDDLQEALEAFMDGGTFPRPSEL